MTDATQANTPAAEAPAATDAPLSEDAIKDILSYDPFAPPPEKEAAAGDPSQSPPAPEAKKATAPDQKAPTTSDPAATAPAAAPQKTPHEVALEAANAQLEQLRQTVARQAEAMANFVKQQEKKPVEGQQPAAPEAAKPAYTVEVPPQLFEAIRSDDPEVARQGLNVMVNSVMNRVHKDVSTLLAEREAAIIAHVSQAVPARMQQQTEVETQARQVHDDFYGTFKELDVPELKPLVTQVATSIAQEVARQGYSPAWTPEFRNAVGERVRAILRATNGGQQSPPPPPPPTSAPAAQIRGGVRPVNTSGLTEEQQEMVGLLNLGF
jgi:hypothetical protein